jgi:hypothetical protein
MLADHPPGVQHARYPAEDGQTDVDEEVRVDARLEQDGDWREEDGEEVEQDVARGGRHLALSCGCVGGRLRLSRTSSETSFLC